MTILTRKLKDVQAVFSMCISSSSRDFRDFSNSYIISSTFVSANRNTTERKTRSSTSGMQRLFIIQTITTSTSSREPSIDKTPTHVFFGRDWVHGFKRKALQPFTSTAEKCTVLVLWWKACRLWMSWGLWSNSELAIVWWSRVGAEGGQWDRNPKEVSTLIELWSDDRMNGI